MMKVLLIVILAAFNLLAADKFKFMYDRTVITDMVVVQQPADNARGVQFDKKWTIYCDDACEVWVYRDGPAMTCGVPANCEVTPYAAVTSAALPRFKVYYTASSVTGAVLLGRTKFIGSMPFDMEDLKLTRNGTTINYYIKLTSTSGVAIRFVINGSVTQE